MDTDLLVTAVDQMQEILEEHTAILQQLEARPILDLTGIERRMEELADAIEQQQIPRQERRRPWWLTPMLLTLACVLGVVSTYALLLWAQQRAIAGVKLPQTPAATAPATAGKKGK